MEMAEVANEQLAENKEVVELLRNFRDRQDSPYTPITETVISPEWLQNQQEVDALTFQSVIDHLHRVTCDLSKLLPKGFSEVNEYYKSRGYETWVKKVNGSFGFVDFSGSTALGELCKKKFGDEEGAEIVTEIFNLIIWPTLGEIRDKLGISMVNRYGDAEAVFALGDKHEERLAAFAVLGNYALDNKRADITSYLANKGLDIDAVRAVEIGFRIGLESGSFGIGQFEHGYNGDVGYVVSVVGEAPASAERLSDEADKHSIVLPQEMYKKLSKYVTLPSIQEVILQYNDRVTMGKEYVKVSLASDSEGETLIDSLELDDETLERLCDGNVENLASGIAQVGLESPTISTIQDFEEALQYYHDKIDHLQRFFQRNTAQRYLELITRQDNLALLEFTLIQTPVIFAKLEGLNTFIRSVFLVTDGIANHNKADEEIQKAWSLARTAHRTIFEPVISNGGVIEKTGFAGNAEILVAYGLPGADALDNMLLAAYQIQQSLLNYQPLSLIINGSAISLELKLNAIGLHDGWIAKSIIGGDRMTIYGSVANNTARLMYAYEDLEENGCILISNAVGEQLVHSNLIIELDEFTYKGKGLNGRQKGSVVSRIEKRKLISLIGGDVATTQMEVALENVKKYGYSILLVNSGRFGSGGKVHLDYWEHKLEGTIAAFGRASFSPQSSFNAFYQLAFNLAEITGNRDQLELLLKIPQETEQSHTYARRVLETLDIAINSINVSNGNQKEIVLSFSDVHLASKEAVTIIGEYVSFLNLMAKKGNCPPVLLIFESKYDHNRQFESDGENLVVTTYPYGKETINTTPTTQAHIKPLNNDEQFQLAQSVVKRFADTSDVNLSKAVFNGLNNFNHVSKLNGNAYMLRILIEDLFVNKILRISGVGVELDQARLETYRYPPQFMKLFQSEYDAMSYMARKTLNEVYVLKHLANKAYFEVAYQEATKLLEITLQELIGRNLITINKAGLISLTEGYLTDVLSDFMELHLNLRSGIQINFIRSKFAMAVERADRFSGVAAEIYKQMGYVNYAAEQYIRAAFMGYALNLYNDLGTPKSFFEAAQKLIEENNIDLTAVSSAMFDVLQQQNIKSSENQEVIQKYEFLFQKITEDGSTEVFDPKTLLKLVCLTNKLKLTQREVAINQTQLINRIINLSKYIVRQRKIADETPFQDLYYESNALLMVVRLLKDLKISDSELEQAIDEVYFPKQSVSMAEVAEP